MIGKWKIQRRIRLSILTLLSAHSRYYRARIESASALSKNEIQRRYLEAVNEPTIDRVAHHLHRLTTHRRKQIHNLRLPKREKTRQGSWSSGRFRGIDSAQSHGRVSRGVHEFLAFLFRLFMEREDRRDTTPAFRGSYYENEAVDFHSEGLREST